MIRAKLDDRFGRILRSVIGFLFLGTPHRGFTRDQYKALSEKWSGKKLREGLLQAFADDCDALSQLNTSFKSLASKINIFSFIGETVSDDQM
jgi:hypothetical protein